MSQSGDTWRTNLRYPISSDRLVPNPRLLRARSPDQLALEEQREAQNQGSSQLYSMLLERAQKAGMQPINTLPALPLSNPSSYHSGSEYQETPSESGYFDTSSDSSFDRSDTGSLGASGLPVSGPGSSSSHRRTSALFSQSTTFSSGEVYQTPPVLRHPERPYEGNIRTGDESQLWQSGSSAVGSRVSKRFYHPSRNHSPSPLSGPSMVGSYSSPLPTVPTSYGPSWLSPTGESFRSVNQGLLIQQTNTASLLSSGSSASLASAHSSAETPSIAGHWPDLPTSYPTVRVPTYVQAGLAQNAFARPQLPVAWPNVGYDAPVTPTGAESSFPGPYNLSFAPPPQLFLGQFIDPQFNTATPINPSVTPDQPQHDMYPAHDLPSSHFPAPPMSYYSLPEISKPPVDGIKYCIPSDEQWSRWIIGTEIRYLTGYWRDSPGLLQWRQSTVEIKNARRALHLSMDSLPDGCRWMERPTVDADLAKICNKVNKINASNSRYIKENIATIFPSIAPTDSTIKKGTHQWNITVQQGAAALNIDEGFLHTTAPNGEKLPFQHPGFLAFVEYVIFGHKDAMGFRDEINFVNLTHLPFAYTSALLQDEFTRASVDGIRDDSPFNPAKYIPKPFQTYCKELARLKLTAHYSAVMDQVSFNGRERIRKQREDDAEEERQAEVRRKNISAARIEERSRSKAVMQQAKERMRREREAAKASRTRSGRGMQPTASTSTSSLSQALG